MDVQTDNTNHIKANMPPELHYPKGIIMTDVDSMAPNIPTPDRE
jgi:hypothetical protein